MKILLDYDLNISQSDLESLYNKIPDWRKFQVDNYHNLDDKIKCIKSFLLLQNYLIEEYNIDYIPQFSYKANSKPYLAEYPDICFNISHTNTAVMSVVGDKEIGCDIQTIPKIISNKMLVETLSDSEFNKALNSTNKELEFTKFWTMKESYLKMTGEGICIDRKVFRNLLVNIDKSQFNMITKVYNDTVYSICEKV